MEKDFDWTRIGKRMPYTTPDNFFDKLEEEVWKEVREGPGLQKRRKRFALPFPLAALAVAASIALLLVFQLPWTENGADDAFRVEEAFANLTNEDQAYLLEVYQEDIFMNE